MLNFALNCAMSSKQEDTRKIIVHTYLKNPKSSYSSIAKIVKKDRSVVRRIIIRYENLLTTKRKTGTGLKKRL